MDDYLKEVGRYGVVIPPSNRYTSLVCLEGEREGRWEIFQKAAAAATRSIAP